MDPFDEFEFKPLTEGLGFNKKPATLKDQIKDSGVVSEHFDAIPATAPRSSEDLTPKKAMTFDDVIKSLEKAPLKPSNKGFLDITEPLPRAKYSPSPEMSRPQVQKTSNMEVPRPLQSPFPSQDIFRQPMPGMKKSPPAIKETARVGTRRGAADSPQGRLVPTQTSLPAASLDLIVATALMLIFLAVLMTTTKTDLNIVMRGINHESWTRVSFVILFLAIMQMYVVISRSFFGCTLGEWTFDVQLGKSEDQLNPFFPLKVIARSLIVTVTGLIILPLLSLVMGEDIAGMVSGTQLYEQK